jgi:hypothetical protein
VRLAFATPDLDALDALTCECLVLTVFADDRPLRGLAGLVDWRLCGRLSALLQRDVLSGGLGQATLMPMPAGRLAARRLLVVGLGRRAEFEGPRFERACAALLGHVAGIGCHDAALTLPGRIGLEVSLREALLGFGRALSAAFSAEALLDLRLTLLEAPEVQAELGEPLRELAQRLREEAASAVGRPEDAAAAEPAPASEIADRRSGMRRLLPADGGEGELLGG